MRHGVSSANEYIDLREKENRSLPLWDGPLVWSYHFVMFETTSRLSKCEHSRFRTRPKRIPSSFASLRIENVIGEHRYRSCVNIFAAFAGEDASKTWIMSLIIPETIWRDNYILYVVSRFVRFIETAIPRHKIIRIDFNYDDIYDVLAPRSRDTLR